MLESRLGPPTTLLRGFEAVLLLSLGLDLKIYTPNLRLKFWGHVLETIDHRFYPEVLKTVDFGPHFSRYVFKETKFLFAVKISKHLNNKWVAPKISKNSII